MLVTGGVVGGGVIAKGVDKLNITVIGDCIDRLQRISVLDEEF